jgi:uncharacterized protein
MSIIQQEFLMHSTSDYVPSRLLSNPHLHTIYARYIREFIRFDFTLEEFDLPDGDCIELAWSKQNSKKLVLLNHGLEGKADAPYMRSTARAFSLSGWDVLSWSFRGCGRRPNRFARSYHCGFTDDLRFLINTYAPQYDEVVLVGFSVGGSLCIKYLGENPSQVPSQVSRAIAISSPVDLAETAYVLKLGANRIYLKYFLQSFKRKLRVKRHLFPESISRHFFDGIKDFESYDNKYTAPWFGYADARAYWKDASCRQFINDVKIPLLFMTAEDDTFFRASNIPYREVLQNPNLKLLAVPKGGHVGFFQGLGLGHSWMERSTLHFANLGSS